MHNVMSCFECALHHDDVVIISESVIEVILYYPWQPSVNIYYTITAVSVT